MMRAVRDIRMGIWRGVARMSLGKVMAVLMFNAIIMLVVLNSGEEEMDMSHIQALN